MARKEKRFDGEAGASDSIPGWDVGGEELKAESSVRRRLVGVREDEDEGGEERLPVPDIWARYLCYCRLCER
jgi:hypothetical protein